MSDYHVQVSKDRIEKLRSLERELPKVCSDFFLSISHTTSILTRLAYAYDYHVFFQYLVNENPLFGDIEPRLLKDEDFAKITVKDLIRYQDYLTLYFVNQQQNATSKMVQNNESGIMRKMCSLRSLFEYLFQQEIIPANITTKVALPKLHEKPILRLEHDEMQKMLDTVASGEGLTGRQQKFLEFTKTRDTALLMLFLGTGIRVSECVGLNIYDIDLNSGAFLITRKGGNQAILYFPESVSTALQNYLEERNKIVPLEGHEDALFLSLQRRRLTQRAIENLVKKYASIAAPLKTRISPHKLRSTFGTNLYQETGDIYLVADVLGHTDVNTTRRHYAAMSEENKREAAKKIPLPITKQKNEE